MELRCDSITGMAGMLHPPSATARIVVALRAYFDESGTHWSGPNACNVFVLCGYVAPESLWDDKTENGFIANWNGVMHGRPFHATEMESNPQGPDVKLALANLVNKCGVIGIGGGLSIPHYKELLLPYVQRTDGTDNPYLFLFADVICEAVKRSDMFVGENPDEPIAFVFAAHKKWSLDANQFYEQVKNDENTPIEVRRRMGTVAFEEIDEFVPLQAADHLAFETYSLYERSSRNVAANHAEIDGLATKPWEALQRTGYFELYQTLQRRRCFPVTRETPGSPFLWICRLVRFCGKKLTIW